MDRTGAESGVGRACVRKPPERVEGQGGVSTQRVAQPWQQHTSESARPQRARSRAGGLGGQRVQSARILPSRRDVRDDVLRPREREDGAERHVEEDHAALAQQKDKTNC